MNRFKFATVTTMVFSALIFVSTLTAQTPKPVRTDAGPVQGSVENGITIYKGIPFAAPPLGDLRWRAPKPAAPWKDVLQADKFAPACMQVPVVMPALGLDALTVNEDCLYLNVWTPAKMPKDKLAVMVWIYGGGFTIGGTSLAQYDGRNLAKKGVMLVSIAYRLGALGFLASPELSAEQGGHSGNYGLMDQIAGLQWVKKNIAAFGGDPNRVTIFGESAGGIAVSMLAASPLAKGLFTGAISESGGSFAPPRLGNEGGENVPPLAVAERNGTAFLAKLGASSIGDARKKSADEILKSSAPGLGGSWPNFDGYVLLGDQYKLYEASHFNDTPILIGTNADEGALFVPSITAAAYESNVRAGFADYADKILAAYPAGSDAEALRSARDLQRDSLFAWSTWSWARLQSKTGKGKTYVYYFSHRPQYPDAPQFKSWGAAHGSEIAFVFGNFAAAMPATDADKRVSDEVSSYWVNFAKAGDPNGSALPAWPAFTDANQQVMNLNDPSKAIPAPNLEKLQVLDGYYAWRRSQAATKP
ncbi:MAG TPA: carboxylesterase/lipase family protein [Candidatus Acidoferrales bacterium]|jgi:para-nitrobenzyl esterase|nr:carboxylesterase/lipase family protein [Candidatus Acidoferrales bacterium]